MAFCVRRKRKLFLPLKLAPYNIPRDIRRCILDGTDLGAIVHALRELSSSEIVGWVFCVSVLVTAQLQYCSRLGLFTWREEDPSTRKILEGETTFRLVYMQKFQSGWLPSGEGKQDEIVGP